MKFFVKKFCETVQARVVIFGKQVDNDVLYRGIANQYSPAYLWVVGWWSGGAMVLGKLPVPGRPTIWISVGQGPIALAVGAGGGCLDIFVLIYPFFPLSPSLWETARYRLKYCLKGPLNPKQPTNQPAYFSLHLSDFLSFHTLNDEILRQRVL